MITFRLVANEGKKKNGTDHRLFRVYTWLVLPRAGEYINLGGCIEKVTDVWHWLDHTIDVHVEVDPTDFELLEKNVWREFTDTDQPS
jgi:hypothetical protein